MSENMEYMEAIAKGIAGSHDVQQLDWQQISIIVALDEDGYITSTSGYAYDEAAKPIGVAPDIDDIESAVLAYRDWLQQNGDKGFLKMLFQIDKATLKVKAHFEYEDASRWKVTPRNIDYIREELRPKFAE